MTRRAGKIDTRSLLADEDPPPPRRGGHHLGLVFPGTYAESSSSLGVHFVITAVRSAPGCSLGRILPPSGDHRPSTLEDSAPPAGLPVLMVSVPWEPMIGPLVEILRRAGIPPLASDRDGVHPVVIAGGALATSNPDLLVPLADVVVRGDGERSLDALLDLVPATSDRDGLIETLSRLDGAREGTRAACPADDLPASSAFVTPHSALPSMHLVEVVRGCAHGCTFCVMSRRRTGAWPRHVPPAAVLGSIPGGVRRVGLVGPSVLEHPGIEQILSELASRGLEVGISSARADRVDDSIAGLLASAGLRTLTVALDGPSARIRAAIRKTVEAGDVIRAARLARDHGMARLKLYAMVGFEGETDDDARELAETCLELAGTTSLTLSVGPVVPKKSTPLEAMEFVDRPTYETRLGILRRALGRRARVDAASWREARVEATLSLMPAERARELYASIDPATPFDLGRALGGHGPSTGRP